MLHPRRCVLGSERAKACSGLAHTPMLVVDAEMYLLYRIDQTLRKNEYVLYTLVTSPEHIHVISGLRSWAGLQGNCCPDSVDATGTVRSYVKEPALTRCFHDCFQTVTTHYSRKKHLCQERPVEKNIFLLK